MNHNGTSRGPVKWQRVLLKVSGEALAGDCEQNINPKVTMAIAREVTDVTRLGVEPVFTKRCKMLAPEKPSSTSKKKEPNAVMFVGLQGVDQRFKDMLYHWLYVLTCVVSSGRDITLKFEPMRKIDLSRNSNYLLLSSVDFLALRVGPELENKLKYVEHVCEGVTLISDALEDHTVVEVVDYNEVSN
ncbi:aspartate/glutamate/uridylate kinase [Tanacetum coccineum]